VENSISIMRNPTKDDLDTMLVEIPATARHDQADVLMTGSTCQGRWADGNAWYDGLITSGPAQDGSFDIAYEDGDTELCVPADRVRPLKSNRSDDARPNRLKKNMTANERWDTVREFDTKVASGEFKVGRQGGSHDGHAYSPIRKFLKEKGITMQGLKRTRDRLDTRKSGEHKSGVGRPRKLNLDENKPIRRQCANTGQKCPLCQGHILLLQEHF
jgi:hypothetical protein